MNHRHEGPKVSEKPEEIRGMPSKCMSEEANSAETKSKGKPHHCVLLLARESSVPFIMRRRCPSIRKSKISKERGDSPNTVIVAEVALRTDE
jgi:hypothetical protein